MKKKLGQFFTPPHVARFLVRWAARKRSDAVLDPACGDGEFLALHSKSTGVDIDGQHLLTARARAPKSKLVESDFFEWAENTPDRYDAILGNPPFIRYHGFSGDMRKRALRLSERVGARFSELTSSWAPFVAVGCALLKRGGRIAFVVPAEIGHSTYASTLIESLASNFGLVHVTAVREKLFPDLSEDAWILQADDFGSQTSKVRFSAVESFEENAFADRSHIDVAIADWRLARGRLRRWLLSSEVLDAYFGYETSQEVFRVGDVATVGIGYVTGQNEFFHLRPSVVRELGIPAEYLRVAVRKGQKLGQSDAITKSDTARWIEEDEPVLLLSIGKNAKIPEAIEHYLARPQAECAKRAYKCRARTPWYSVPGVDTPEAFLTYMSGLDVRLVRNEADCVGTNSVHVVRTTNGQKISDIQRMWKSSLTQLSCEIEGHPLGGGLLKLEPGEAKRVLLPKCKIRNDLEAVMQRGIETMRSWRHAQIGPAT